MAKAQATAAVTRAATIQASGPRKLRTSRTSASPTAGTVPATSRAKIRGGTAHPAQVMSQAELLGPAVKGAARQAERGGRLLDVARAAGDGLGDDLLLHLLQGEILEGAGRIRRGRRAAECQVGG